MFDSTIAAIATPMGDGGIGIIRISGQKALPIARSVFQKSDSDSNPTTENLMGENSGVRPAFKSHHLYHGFVVDPESGHLFDEVLLVVMKAPHTYTREDVVEIHTHAGRVVLNAVLELVLRHGATLAEPGEFTKRAFINGRIDLTQAEAVVDIINARTERSLKLAASMIMGGLKEQIEFIRATLIKILAEIEGSIDFPEEIEQIVDLESTLEIIEHQVIAPLKGLIDRYHDSHFVRDGLKLVIVGKPNVGKSSLMNCLVQRDRAIVTAVPGTTRDFIEEHFNLHGIPVIITDTAGIQETSDPIEVIGVQKTKENIYRADLVLFMVEASGPISSEDEIVYRQLPDKPLILVINKVDLVDKDFSLGLPDYWQTLPRITTSARYHSGIDALKDLIVQTSVGHITADSGNTLVPNLRQKVALEQSVKALLSAAEGMRNGVSFDMVAIDIKAAVDSLGRITGITVHEDILDEIFNRFCIGK